MAEFLVEIQGRLTREEPEPDERNLHQEGHDDSPSDDQVGDPQTVCSIHIPSPTRGERAVLKGAVGAVGTDTYRPCPSAGRGGKRGRTGGVGRVVLVSEVEVRVKYSSDDTSTQEDFVMPHYISLLNWTDQGIKSVKESPKRADAAMALANKLGAKMQIFYTMGEYDLVSVTEAPNDDVVMQVLLELGKLGNIRTKTLK